MRETKAALYDERTVDLLRAYYDPSGVFAGGSFLSVQPNPATTITPTDLFALSLLDVRASPRGARNLLIAGEHRRQVRAALKAFPGGVELLSASHGDLDDAEDTYLAIKSALGANPWVTASKLCARKRPEFFPVRDNVVTVRRLGLGTDHRVDWLVYRELLGRTRIASRLERLIAQARGNGDISITDPPLRTLDVILWMTASKETRRGGRWDGS